MAGLDVAVEADAPEPILVHTTAVGCRVYITVKKGAILDIYCGLAKIEEIFGSILGWRR